MTGADAGRAPALHQCLGSVASHPGCPPDCDGSDGHGFESHYVGNNNGIPDLRAPLNPLIGVFLGPERPDLTPPPAMLNFEHLGLNFSSLSPQLLRPTVIANGSKVSAKQLKFR
jgi:hypothetical protein